MITLLKDLDVKYEKKEGKRPLTVEEWKTVKGMYRRITDYLKYVICTSKTDEEMDERIEKNDNITACDKFDNANDIMVFEYDECNGGSNVDYIKVFVQGYKILPIVTIAIKGIYKLYDDYKVDDEMVVVESNGYHCGTLYNLDSETIVICPHCGEIQDECNMPDLFYKDSSNTKGMNDQLKLLRELQTLNYNVVTCGNCGKVLITKRGE